jgi:hypothetical protein
VRSETVSKTSMRTRERPIADRDRDQEIGETNFFENPVWTNKLQALH